VRSTSEETHKDVGIDLGLSTEEKETLRRIAREAIRSRCLKTPMATEPPVLTPKLEESRGAFVCLKENDGHLRGCIGMIVGRAPLHQTIREMAVQAAFADPRFCPVGPGELDGLELEISVLTPMERIHDVEAIRIGAHGLWICRGDNSGLLLPQVAVEHGWSREEFLKWTCQKAGLPPQAWKDKETEIYVFSADIF